MPRVHTTTKSTRGRTYACIKCGKDITPGQTFYWWEKRFGGTYRQHTACGYPRPSQLSNRKTAQIEDVLQDLDLTSISYQLPDGFEPQEEGNAIDIDQVVEQITEALSDVASTARDVGQEYEASADNMPESLQQGYQAEAMRDVAQRLEEWADQLEDPCSSGSTAVDLPDPGDHTEDCPTCKGSGRLEWKGGRQCHTCQGTGSVPSRDGYRQAAQEAIDEAVQALVDEAQGLVDEMPEYEG